MRHRINACGLEPAPDSGLSIQKSSPQPQSSISSSGMGSRKSGACPAVPSAKPMRNTGFCSAAGVIPSPFSAAAKGSDDRACASAIFICTTTSTPRANVGLGNGRDKARNESLGGATCRGTAMACRSLDRRATGRRPSGVRQVQPQPPQPCTAFTTPMISAVTSSGTSSGVRWRALARMRRVEPAMPSCITCAMAGGVA